MAPALIYLLFGLTGICLGLLGAGGGILTLPLLVNAAGIEAHRAVPMSLAIVGAASLIGAGLSARHGRLAPRAGLTLGAAGMLGAQLGAALTPRAPANLILLIFALVMAGAGTAMLRRSREPAGGEAPAPAPAHRATLLLLPAGFTIGILTGFLGVGGGFLILPALVMIGGVDIHRAAGTSMGVIALNSGAALWRHARGERIAFGETLPYLAMAIGGMLLGLALVRRVPARRLELGFAVLVLGLALVIGGMSLARLLGG